MRMIYVVTMVTTTKGTTMKTETDQVGRIMAYEQGDLSDEDTITLYQELIDSGLAWRLQGHYGRTAKALIDAGYCHKATGKA
jgi:hypothetical protein